jgi:hypothetical protein
MLAKRTKLLGTERAGKMKRIVPLLIVMALPAGCVPHPEPESPPLHRYSDDELANLPVAQRCNYLSSQFTYYLADRKTYDTWKTMLQKWGCIPTLRDLKPAS